MFALRWNRGGNGGKRDNIERRGRREIWYKEGVDEGWNVMEGDERHDIRGGETI